MGIRRSAAAEGRAIPLSRAGDPFEREADALSHRAFSKGEAKPALHTARSSAEVTAGPSGLERGGTPLCDETRSFFGTRFGHDFGRVRIHTDSRAGDAARSLGARAFTFGSDVAFAPGEYRPNTPEGRRLLAHELVHVAQQANGPARLMRACDCDRLPGAQWPRQIQQKVLSLVFPNLREGDWCVTGPKSDAYNCFAWSVGVSNRWIEDEVDSRYGDADYQLELSDFDAFYAAHGLRPIIGTVPADAEVALFARGDTPTHAARRRKESCGVVFESKIGTYLRIAHVLRQLEGGSHYGDINRYYVPAAYPRSTRKSPPASPAEEEGASW